MRHVSDEAWTLHVEDETSWLATSAECNFHSTFIGHLVDVSVSADSKEISFTVLRGAVQGHIQLEDALEVCLGLVYTYHFVFKSYNWQRKLIIQFH